jgi:hypothetical protein
MMGVGGQGSRRAREAALASGLDRPASRFFARLTLQPADHSQLGALPGGQPPQRNYRDYRYHQNYRHHRMLFSIMIVDASRSMTIVRSVGTNQPTELAKPS